MAQELSNSIVLAAERMATKEKRYFIATIMKSSGEYCVKAEELGLKYFRAKHFSGAHNALVREGYALAPEELQTRHGDCWKRLNPGKQARLFFVKQCDVESTAN